MDALHGLERVLCCARGPTEHGLLGCGLVVCDGGRLGGRVQGVKAVVDLPDLVVEEDAEFDVEVLGVGNVCGLAVGPGKLLHDGEEFLAVVCIGIDSVLEDCFLCGFQEEVVCVDGGFEGYVSSRVLLFLHLFSSRLQVRLDSWRMGMNQLTFL